MKVEQACIHRRSRSRHRRAAFEATDFFHATGKLDDSSLVLDRLGERAVHVPIWQLRSISELLLGTG